MVAEKTWKAVDIVQPHGLFCRIHGFAHDCRLHATVLLSSSLARTGLHEAAGHGTKLVVGTSWRSWLGGWGLALMIRIGFWEQSCCLDKTTAPHLVLENGRVQLHLPSWRNVALQLRPMDLERKCGSLPYAPRSVVAPSRACVRQLFRLPCSRIHLSARPDNQHPVESDHRRHRLSDPSAGQFQWKCRRRRCRYSLLYVPFKSILEIRILTLIVS